MKRAALTLTRQLKRLPAWGFQHLLVLLWSELKQTSLWSGEHPSSRGCNLTRVIKHYLAIWAKTIAASEMTVVHTVVQRTDVIAGKLTNNWQTTTACFYFQRCWWVLWRRFFCFVLFCFVLQRGTISEEAGEELQQRQRRRVAWSFSAHDSCHKHKHTRGCRDGERYCEVTQVHRQVGVRHRQYRAYSLIRGFLYSFSYHDRQWRKNVTIRNNHLVLLLSSLDGRKIRCMVGCNEFSVTGNSVRNMKLKQLNYYHTSVFPCCLIIKGLRVYFKKCIREVQRTWAENDVTLCVVSFSVLCFGRRPGCTYTLMRVSVCVCQCLLGGVEHHGNHITFVCNAVV